MDEIIRCWGDDDEQMAKYHDTEWGTPVHDDRTHFEFLLLDNFQAGLSWKTILHRRPGFRNAFAQFDPAKVAKFNDTDRLRLLADVGIIRNRAKVKAAIINAQTFLKVQDEFGSFDKYIWQFTGGKMLVPAPMADWTDIRATSPESDAMSKDLKSRGFSFVGSTICYAYMQSIGMAWDHLSSCHRYEEYKSANHKLIKF